jgi:putative transposase
LICAFIDAHRDRFGVVPICRALSGQGIAIAPRTYWARRSRPPSPRAVRDAALTEMLAGIYQPDEKGRRPPECLYGSLKMRDYLRRQGIRVARCTVERLMRANGWRGVTRARTVRTTIPDPAHSRAPDLVKRDFAAERPGQLHVAGFTYVPLDGAHALTTGRLGGSARGRRLNGGASRTGWTVTASGSIRSTRRRLSM